MKVSDYIVRTLAAHAVRNVFVVAGGMIAHLLDSLFKNDDVKTVVTRHEQAAAFAAGAVGRTTGLPGIACATSGPGATNLLTGIADCYYDSAPALFITGQVNRYEQKGTRGVRQFGFQECDIAALAEHVTKAAWRVQDQANCLLCLKERSSCPYPDGQARCFSTCRWMSSGRKFRNLRRGPVRCAGTPLARRPPQT